MQQLKLYIVNKLGLHARAAAKLVTVANRFASESRIIKGNKTVNAKSIMGLMMLGANKGTEVEVQAEGEDETSALQAITTLINNRFDEAE